MSITDPSPEHLYEICERVLKRACVVNHRTTDSDIDEVVPEVLAAAKEVLAK